MCIVNAPEWLTLNSNDRVTNNIMLYTVLYDFAENTI